MNAPILISSDGDQRTSSEARETSQQLTQSSQSSQQSSPHVSPPSSQQTSNTASDRMDTSPERPVEASYPPSSASFTESSDTSPGETSMERLTIGLRRSSRRLPLTTRTPSVRVATRNRTPELPVRVATRSQNGSRQNLRSRTPQTRASSSQTPKRRRTSRVSSSSTQSASESAISSSLDCEVTIYTKGTSVPQSQTRCCICSQVLHGGPEEINAHIDQCLGGQSQPDVMVEYEWAGQTRVRTTALVEGGLVAAGVADAGSSHSSTRPSDEDVDVDTRDETHYGVPQFGDSDLVVEQGVCNRSHERRPSDPQFEYLAADPQSSDSASDLQPEDSVSEPQPGDSTPQLPIHKHGPSHAASQLVIEALKARIREQDRELQRAPKCSVCQGAFDEPCASINCWHVFCTSCWMRSLGAKKLCPQCQQITQPYDLRRIYM
ncbi:hypothetical protein GGH12_001198 [Coemansia sp. RSA 1822]|nr:hypothetical protein LPJ76_001071 [Coemansia sp. RSA 638]KAJ2565765.1 hypothetical protein GGH12_001198 [Coemansia sp. RSA 1822]